MIVERGRALLIFDVPNLDKAIRRRRDELLTLSHEVDPEDRIRVALKRLHGGRQAISLGNGCLLRITAHVP